MKMKKLLLAAVLAVSAACSADVTVPEPRTAVAAGPSADDATNLTTATTTTTESDSTSQTKETGLVGPSGGK
jgi:hypothetical protein